MIYKIYVKCKCIAYVSVFQIEGGKRCAYSFRQSWKSDLDTGLYRNDSIKTIADALIY